MESKKVCIKIRITGIVQGVGFRPFVFKLAKKNGINGWVKNTEQGVIIEAEGIKDDVENFSMALIYEAPEISFIEECKKEIRETVGYKDFRIIESGSSGSHSVFISPDLSICNNCLNETNDPINRRYKYPFTNCTNCGPRFTITKGIPYDRFNTVMSKFGMCDECKKEYYNPSDRRFHAQPISCHECGPTLELLDNKGNSIISKDILEEVKRLLGMGKIIAIKGLGGYHLACDAKNDEAVRRLRVRKHRDGKPFAVMADCVDTVKEYCKVNLQEEKLLKGIRRPIVLLEKKDNICLSKEISKDNSMLGVMLPYTPLHLLLFNERLNFLVMTSGNISGEPIYYKNSDAIEGLKDIADYFLVHDRDIYVRTDDSVTSVIEGKEMIIRRSRGYVPFPINIPIRLESNSDKIPSVLATGGELKNTFCLTKNKAAFLSHHIGDLENEETLESFESGIEHFKKMLEIDPQIIVCDMHKRYLSTQYAQNVMGKSVIYVQHHHAHIASCMAENGIMQKVIGVAFDGTGYGSDGHIWGGEFFYGDYSNFERIAHLKYVPIPGGEVAIKEPWRMTLGYLNEIYTDVLSDLDINFIKSIDVDKVNFVIHQIRRGLNCPLTSSVGRLFDAVSSLLGFIGKIEYEGQAAILLENMADRDERGCYEVHFEKNNDSNQIEIDFKFVIKQIIDDIKCNVRGSTISAKFHNTMAFTVLKVCSIIRENTSTNKVVLSGGVFQNRILLTRTIDMLTKHEFEVYTHEKVPTNDGGISLGQAVIGVWKSLYEYGFES